MLTNTNEVILYLRKSQDKRGQVYSIAAQRDYCQDFCNRNQLVITGEYIDVASGMDDERPAFIKACKEASMTGKSIVIKRTDRIGRKPSTVFSLLENNRINIIVAELGMSASLMQIGIGILFSFHERELISKRTKAGIEQARRAGKKLGNPNIDKARQLSNKSNREKGKSTALKYAPILRTAVETTGSLRKAAKWLNENGIPTPTKSGRWYSTSISTILNRAKMEVQANV